MHTLRRFGWLLLLGMTGVAAAYDGQVLNDQGSPVAGATIKVVSATAPGTPAAIFELDGTPKANPFAADALGRYSFSAAAGDYDIAIAAPGLSTTLVGVPVVDPQAPYVMPGDDRQAPLALVESSDVATAGNAALVLERRRADGTPIGGPWSLHVNQGSATDPADLLWLYNVDWNETAQTRSALLDSDAAFALHFAPRSLVAGPPAVRRFSLSYDYAPAGVAGTTPSWTTPFQTDEATFAGIGTMHIVRAGGGPFVVGDGLANSSLAARRVGWSTFHTTAPAGVLSPVVDPQPPMKPGDVGIPTSVGPYPGVAPATEHAALDASVFVSGGNGNPPSLLTVGKALVRVASGVVASPGDVVVSSASESGRAEIDNGITDPRRTIGFALEPVGATLPGYLAIVRTSR